MPENTPFADPRLAMRKMRLILAVLVLFSCASAASAAHLVGVVVRDGADPEWPGALVLRDVFQNPTIIGLLPEGTEVDILPHLSNATYVYVVADGIRGWVKRQFVSEMAGVHERPHRPGGPRPVLFSDIPEDHWAREAVERLVRAGLIERRTPHFYGETPVTRYELAVVLDRAMRKVAQSAEDVDSRLRALESGRGVLPAGARGSEFHNLLSLASTIHSLAQQSEELKGRLDAIDSAGSQQVAMQLRLIEHRLDAIENAMGRG